MASKAGPLSSPPPPRNPAIVRVLHRSAARLRQTLLQAGGRIS